MAKCGLRQLIVSGCFVVIALMANGQSHADDDEPIKVFILAGQSNMQGHARVETFDYIGDDPKTIHLLKMMRDENGHPRTCKNVWISYLTAGRNEAGEGFGQLTTGYGARIDPTQDGGKIGPEFTFGLTLDKTIDGPVLIIKTAWGGKSLFHDFRPPSAGLYEQSAQDKEKNRFLPEESGHYYRLMMGHVHHILKDIQRVVPGYDNNRGYELSGFIWFQGWNDMVNRNVYPINPDSGENNRFDEYSRLLTQFIRDVRSDLKTPQMPFVVGVMGVGGEDANEGNLDFRKAMAAPASDPDLQNVVAVPTAPFWDERLAEIDNKRGQVRQMAYFLRTAHKNHANKDGMMSQDQQREYLKSYEAELISPAEAALFKRGASNAGYHYLGCAKTFALMGRAYAEALLDMMDSATP